MTVKSSVVSTRDTALDRHQDRQQDRHTDSDTDHDVYGYGPQFLMIPGPAPVSDRVRHAMQRQSVDFSSTQFIDYANGVFESLKPIFQTQSEVFLYAANGHGAWEAALANTLNPGDVILMPETGLFSEAWRQMANGLGIQCETVANDWRHGVDASRVQQVLAADTEHRIKAVLLVHTDTSCSVTSDIPAVRRAIDAARHPALLMVDAIASLCTTPFQMDDWRIDVAVTASQKALSVPPGLAIMAVSRKALEVSERSRTRQYYWSWSERLKGEHYKRFCGTAPEQLVFALGEALALINAETLAGCIARHQRLAAMVQAAVGKWSEAGFLEFNALLPHERATSVTTIRVPEAFDAERIRTVARQQYNVVIGGGLGNLRGKIIRIGHMGFINTPYVFGALGALEQVFRQLQVPVGSGALEAALSAATEFGRDAE